MNEIKQIEAAEYSDCSKQLTFQDYFEGKPPVKVCESYIAFNSSYRDVVKSQNRKVRCRMIKKDSFGFDRVIVLAHHSLVQWLPLTCQNQKKGYLQLKFVQTYLILNLNQQIMRNKSFFQVKRCRPSAEQKDHGKDKQLTFEAFVAAIKKEILLVQKKILKAFKAKLEDKVGLVIKQFY